MSKFILQSNNNTKTKVAPLSIINLKTFIAALILSALMVYVWQINNLSTYGYKVRELERQAKNLAEINKDLENKVASQRSLGVIQAKIDQLSFVPVTQVEYLAPISSVIAQK